MFKREEAAADDDFVTKTNKSRKKSSKAAAAAAAASSGNGGEDAGGDGIAASNSSDNSATDGSGGGSMPSSTNSSNATASSSSGAGGSGGEPNISLRPRTMFTVKGRGHTEADGSPAYRPQWSKDGDGFVSNTPSAADNDANRRKGKVVRYSKEELLALHVETEMPPKYLVETAVASEISLPPVGKLPFDYEEIYKQWALNRNRGRGRGRTTTGGAQGNTNEGATASERSRSNGKWDEEAKWDKPKRGGDHQRNEEENSWERGASSRQNDRRGDIWDDVGTGQGESMELDLSSMSAAAEKFRLEMDAMRDHERAKLNEIAAVDMDTFDKKLETAAATGQFDDSDEEVAWDMPLEAELARPVEDSPLLFQASPFDQKLEPNFSLSSLSESTFGLGALPVEVADEWFYLDPQGLEQGPFKTAEMREWFEAGYFKPNLPIKFGREGGTFTSLANHFVQGQLPFAEIPRPRPSPKANLAHEMRINEQQRLMELHQQQQQQQQMMQLQQQQEQQRMLQFNQEEKIRLEMQRLELARQQQNQMFQAQQQLIQQQQQQQQQMLLQQQSSWQRSQREGIMSALGMFGGGGEGGLAGGNDHFHQEQHAPFQSDFRSAHQFDANPSARIQEPAFAAPQRMDDPWGHMGNPTTFNEPATAQPGLFGGDAPSAQMRLHEPSLPESPKPRAEQIADPWRKPASESRPQAEPTPAPATAEPTKAANASPVKEKSKASPNKKQNRSTEASKQTGAWANAGPTKPPSTKTLKDIQADEQRELRKSLEQDDSSLAQMGAQLKMMLGVNAMTGAAPQPAAQRPAPPAPAAAAPMPPAAPAAPTASPWGRAAVVVQAPQSSKSMREILEEEERLAAERAKRSESAPTNSHWMNVVAGTAPTPAAVPKISRLGPVPASVLKSTTRSRASVTGESISAIQKTATTTPSKAESDASFWNFGAAGAAKASGGAPSASSASATSYNSGGAPSEFMGWCAKQIKAINGSDDLTLVEYCATLEDPGEIREYMAAYLGSTPRVSAFATEFIQRKKSGSSKKSSAVDASFSADVDGKKAKRRTKGQKVDPSLLNYSVGS